MLPSVLQVIAVDKYVLCFRASVMAREIGIVELLRHGQIAIAPLYVVHKFPLVLNRLHDHIPIMIQSTGSSKACDVAVIGAGVLGLWAARHAIKRGERVVVLEKRRVGAGASGGFLGALMPHMPDNWNEKKQFQYDGLTSLAEAVRELESDTGHDCEYLQCGRVIPITHENMSPQICRRIDGAQKNWAEDLTLEVCSDGGGKSWLEAGFASHGVQFDNLSARINPRAYLHALAEYARSRAELMEACEVVSLEMHGPESSGVISLSDGTRISAAQIVVANGWEAYPLLQPFFEPVNEGKKIGRGVKGQAVLVEYPHEDDLPIVYHDGCYVVPHTGNRVAIGSTSRNEWSGEPDEFDASDLDFHEKAKYLVPALKDAPIVEKWAGVRPRNMLEGRGTSPWFGPVPGYENLIALMGGFKITFGVAHLNRFLTDAE